MNISCNVSDLAAALRTVSRAQSSVTVLQILSTVLVNADDAGLRVTGTNLERMIEVRVPATVNEAGIVALPAKLLREFLAAVPAATMELTTKGNTAYVKAGGNKATIKGLDAAEFPLRPEVKTAQEAALPAAEFAGVLSHALIAADKTGARPILAGVLLRLDGAHMITAGVDGFRLGTASMAVPNGSEQASAIVPADSLRGIEWGADEVRVAVSDAVARFCVNGMTLWTQLIVGQFPDYHAIVPTQTTTWIQVSTAELASAVRVATLFARESADIVRLTVDTDKQTLTLRATSAELGDNESDVSMQAHDGPRIESTLNVRYLADALAMIEAPVVRMEFTTPARPVVVRPTTGTAMHVVMPMLVQKG